MLVSRRRYLVLGSALAVVMAGTTLRQDTSARTAPEEAAELAVETLDARAVTTVTMTNANTFAPATVVVRCPRSPSPGLAQAWQKGEVGGSS